ncbi:hypothetical protein VNO80_16459 [Phaseolus coccineus]|uniref:Uncharacterized protein n=1 Tax=Phaseolus coccineus TaxID=3886 RepID=A0AAN9MNK8_PHACN
MKLHIHSRRRNPCHSFVSCENFQSSHTALYAVFVDRTRMKKQLEWMSVISEGDEIFAWVLVSPIMNHIN